MLLLCCMAWLLQLLQPHAAAAAGNAPPGSLTHSPLLLRLLPTVRPRPRAITPLSLSLSLFLGTVPGVEVVDWKIPDPHGQSVDAVREIRDTIRGRVLDLAAERGWRLRAGAETMHMAPAAAAAAAGN